MAAATKVKLQNSHTRSIVKVASVTANGADTATIALATDLLHTDGLEITQTANSPKVNITRIWYSVPSSGYVTITRNSVIVATLYGHDTIDNFSLAENNGSDIGVAFSAGGTVILELAKVSGYSSENPDRTGT